jgi:hypothetical protein
LKLKRSIFLGFHVRLKPLKPHNTSIPLCLSPIAAIGGAHDLIIVIDNLTLGHLS